MITLTWTFLDSFYWIHPELIKKFLHLYVKIFQVFYISRGFLLLFSCLLVAHQCNITSITEVVYLCLSGTEWWVKVTEQDSRLSLVLRISRELNKPGLVWTNPFFSSWADVQICLWFALRFLCKVEENGCGVFWNQLSEWMRPCGLLMDTGRGFLLLPGRFLVKWSYRWVTTAGEKKKSIERQTQCESFINDLMSVSVSVSSPI